MALNIPKRIKEKLEQDSGIHSFTLTSVNNLKPWLDANTTVFFPEYTDHSFVHLNEVLATAESIITDESWDTITPEDVSAMIISVLLHDCAMHITEDGFYSLIRDTYPPIKSQYVSVEPKWSDMWSDYIAEAKRFNSDKLKSIFNDSRPISDIPDNKIDLTTRDKLLIGEFMRRHHARAAHEIVFNGVPGTDGKTLKLAEEPRRHFLDLCGFIAKSHNMSLRQAVDKIEYKKRRLHLNTHVPFLMSVLRISDYIQVQATRAPSQLLNIKSLISPISKGEWKKHDAILEISHADEDPEALFIDAEPQDALIFEDLRWLFSDIQRELDEVWAVLGEVYGRYDKMANLGINIRRLRSSLDDINEYTKNRKPDFIPKVLKFRTADSEMMELLIAPLYGNKPEIGIRELVQNAVDACLELQDISSKQGLNIENPNNYDVCVSVIEYPDHGEVIVEDYGVGMTLDTIENYFLNIGASFRNSDRWKKTHETDGSSDINRTGRFGIGLLAAYLLGDELEVETRHINCRENEGLKFRCSRGSKSVTISNIKCHVGTKISVKTSKNINTYLSQRPQLWDWYCLSTPKVKRELVRITDAKEKYIQYLSQDINVPECKSDLETSNWLRVDLEDFDDIIWSHQAFRTATSFSNELHSVLICNGIFINITRYGSNIKFLWDESESILKPRNPSIVIYDPNGQAPLDIQRTHFIHSTPKIIEEVSRAVVVDIIKRFFNDFENKDFANISNIVERTLSLIKLEWYENLDLAKYISAFIFSHKGLSLLDRKIIIKIKPDVLQLIPYDNNLSKTHIPDDNNMSFSFTQASVKSKTGRSDWIKNYFMISGSAYYIANYIFMKDFLLGSRLYMHTKDYNEICESNLIPKYMQENIKVVWENSKWCILENIVTGKLPSLINPEELVEILDKKKLVSTVFHYFNWEREVLKIESVPNYSVADAWLELNNGNPYFKL